jgi:hypothetical protein
VYHALVALSTTYASRYCLKRAEVLALHARHGYNRYLAAKSGYEKTFAMKAHVALDHFKTPNKRFGVSSPLWNMVLGAKLTL